MKYSVKFNANYTTEKKVFKGSAQSNYKKTYCIYSPPPCGI